MTQQEIYQNMTKGEWKAVIKTGTILAGKTPVAVTYKNGMWLRDWLENDSNGEAIVAAVNNTWGKGINPDAVEGLFKALQSLAGLEPWIADIKMKEHFQKTVYSALAAANLNSLTDKL